MIYLLEACQVALWLQAEKIEHLHAHFGTNSAGSRDVAMNWADQNGALLRTVRKSSTSRNLSHCLKRFDAPLSWPGSVHKATDAIKRRDAPGWFGAVWINAGSIRNAPL